MAELSPDSNLPTILPPSIKSPLSQFLQSGNLADIEFLVGPEKISVKAHRIILQMRSDVFASMLSTRWSRIDAASCKAKDALVEQIEIFNLDPEVFKAFLHYLYTDEVVFSTSGDIGTDDDHDLKLESMLDLLTLSDMYGVVPLYDHVSAILSSSLNAQNCVKIYESTKFVGEEVNKNAAQFVKSNISQLLNYNSYLCSGICGGHWALETWLEILTSDELVVEEIDLFTSIAKWADEDEDRISALKTSILPLIRFPIMTCEDFTQVVVPTGLLENSDVVKILLFYLDFKGSLSPTSHLHPFKLSSRSVKRPSNSSELSRFLQKSSPGDIIVLLDNTAYAGPFTLSTSHVTLTGSGPSTSLTTTDPDTVILTLIGNWCTISDLGLHHDFSAFPASNNARHSKPLLEVKGHHNTLSDLEVNTGCYFTEISLPTGGHLPSNKLLKQNPCFAISLLNADSNSVKNLTCINRGNGVSILGINCKSNSISGLTAKNSRDGFSRTDFGTAVSILGGSSHSIQDVSGDWYIKLGDDTESVRMSSCEVLGVSVDGNRGHSFAGVKARKWIKVRGFGHSFDEDCEAARWDWNMQLQRV